MPWFNPQSKAQHGRVVWATEYALHFTEGMPAATTIIIGNV